MKATTITPCFGALVDGVPLAGLDSDALQRLQAIWRQQHVVVLRGHGLDDAGFARFAARLGEIDSIDESDAGETPWGAELPSVERPPCACLLRARTAPAAGGATWFANLAAALHSMPADLVARVQALALQHGPVLQPLVVVQPDTGERALFLGRRRGTRIAGVPEKESERLLNILWSYATAGSVTLCHRWQAGDIVLWNNLTTLYRHDAPAPGSIRRMQRIRLRGRYPLSAPIQKEAA